jgi:hypothetical protein
LFCPLFILACKLFCKCCDSKIQIILQEKEMKDAAERGGRGC